MTAPQTNKLVTIFGGSGFVGRHVVRALAADGWRVRVAVRRPNVAHFLRPAGRVGQVQLLKTNVRDEAQVAAALEGADAVVNLVGILAPAGAQRFDSIHVEAAARIARLANAAGITRLVHFSALGASVDAPSHYFQTKAKGEEEVRGAFPAASIVRAAAIFGQEDQLFNRFASLLRLLPIFPLIGSGKTKLQPVYVGDVADGVARLLRDDKTAGGTFEFFGPEIMTLKAVIEFVVRETGRKRALIPLPFGLAKLQGTILQFLPGALLTRDQVLMLQTDSVGSGPLPDLRTLGISATAPPAIVPSYLWRFRKEGQFSPVPG